MNLYRRGSRLVRCVGWLLIFNLARWRVIRNFLPFGEQELRFDDVGDGHGEFLTDRDEQDPLGLAEGDGEGVLLRERNGKGKSCVSSSSSIGEERS